MSTHNICFHGEIRKIVHVSGAMKWLIQDWLSDKQLFFFCFYYNCSQAGGGRVVRRCHVSHVTRASNWYRLTERQGLLLLFLPFHSCSSSFLPCSSLSSLLLSLLSLFSLSLGDEPKWHTRVDVLLNPNTINVHRLLDAPVSVHWSSAGQ